MAKDDTVLVANEDIIKFSRKNYAKVPTLGHYISGLSFDHLSNDEIVKYSSLQIRNATLYDNGTPAAFGPLDPHLGASRAKDNRSNKGVSSCSTCQGNWDDCIGHWGYINLPFPVFHPGYFKYIISILKCICKSCSRILLTDNEILTFTRRINKYGDNSFVKLKLFNIISLKTQTCTTCPHCNAAQCQLRKVNQQKPELFMKIIGLLTHKTSSSPSTFTIDFNPIFVYRLFLKIPKLDRTVLLIQNPENFIINTLLVPPCSIRPTVSLGDLGTSEDDLTMSLKDIIALSRQISEAQVKGNNISSILLLVESLQACVVKYINSDFPQLQNVFSSLSRPGSIVKLGRGIAQRLKGKDGRFRNNLSGKRVNFSGRTVISPDPNCSVDSLVVPEVCATKLTFPEVVTVYNIEKLRMSVLNGPNVWPGAISITHSNMHKISLRYVNRKTTSLELKIGDIVERHLWDGDRVLFNRQPSLHRMSIMVHTVRVMGNRTFRFNECACTPYNADFDGDEMNCHFPQTYQSQAEAKYLMHISQNICTPKNGSALISATQDFLTACWLLTRKDAFFTRSMLAQVVTFASDSLSKISLPHPAIIKPIELWTGKQVFSLLLRMSNSESTFVNFETAERGFEKPLSGEPNFMCKNDAYVIIDRSELLCGCVGKSTLGSGNKQGLICNIVQYNNNNAVIRLLNRISKFTGRWLPLYGITIGIDDVTPSEIIRQEKAALMKKGFDDVKYLHQQYLEKKLLPDSGLTIAQTFEYRTKKILDDLRAAGGKLAIRHLPIYNKPLIMFLSGGKGTLVNIAQMITCVGQQNVNGKRICDGFVGRSLPHYLLKDANTPRARGFVASSFYDGLDADEFFFHTMSGREGLVDTAVKTADTGYMQRRLVKALEDLSVMYDYTVRTAENQIVQFVYGDDALNPQFMQKKYDVIDLEQTYNHVSKLKLIDYRDFENQIRQTSFSDGSSVTFKRTLSSVDESDSMFLTSNSVLSIDTIVTKFGILPPSSIDVPASSLPNIIESMFSGSLSCHLSSVLEHAATFLLKHAESHVSHLSKCSKYQIFVNNSLLDSDLLLSMRNQLAAWVAVFVDLTSIDRLIPLLPYEFIKWSDFLIDNMASILPHYLIFALESAKQYDDCDTDELHCTKVRVFYEEVREWCHEYAKKMAAARVSNGEPAALTYDDYCVVLASYYIDSIHDSLNFGDYLTIKGLMYLRRLYYQPDTINRVTYDRERLLNLSSDCSYKVLTNASCKWRATCHDNLQVLAKFFDLLVYKYNKALMEPGEAVGAIGAQSIGEPGTQMTLKTFHFAGVASMNVTLGVPRVKEIINATTNISSPIMIIPFRYNKNSFRFAQYMKARIQRVDLGRICDYIKQIIQPQSVKIVIRLDKSCIQRNFFDIDANFVLCRLLQAKTLVKIKLKPTYFNVIHKYKLEFLPPLPSDRSGLSLLLANCVDELQAIPICGVDTIFRSIIQKTHNSDTNKTEYSLTCEGTGLREILNIDGVDSFRVHYNNIMEIRKVLGIEAARSSIITEMKQCMEAYDMDIDIRHMRLLGDIMTFCGDVLGISRQGIQRIKSSVLCLASFEKTNDHLFEASAFNKQESLHGVSESIILGRKVKLGTGSFGLLYKPPGYDSYKMLKDNNNKTILSSLASLRTYNNKLIDSVPDRCV